MKLALALTLSISIHLGIYLYLQDSKIEYQTSKTPSNTNQATSINYVKLEAAPKTTIKKETQAKPKPKPTPKTIKKQELPKILKPIKKKESIKKDIPKNIVKNETIKPQKTKPLIKELPKTLTPEQKEYQKLKDTMTPKTKEYISLYENFEKLPPKTKIFLLKNIEWIGAITQRYLYYPTMSAQTGQEGINVVEFMLFKNGKISDPKIIKSSSYFLLDDNTLETIEAAFHEYPNPSKPTPIRINVKYKIIRE